MTEGIFIKGPNLADKYFFLDQQIQFLILMNGLIQVTSVERNGKLFLVGRIKSIINVGGEKLHCEELENFLENEHIDSSICGIEDKIMERFRGTFVKAKKSTLDSNMLIEQVKSYCEALPTFKRPKKLP